MICWDLQSHLSHRAPIWPVSLGHNSHLLKDLNKLDCMVHTPVSLMLGRQRVGSSSRPARDTYIARLSPKTSKKVLNKIKGNGILKYFFLYLQSRNTLVNNIAAIAHLIHFAIFWKLVVFLPHLTTQKIKHLQTKSYYFYNLPH